MWEFSFKFKIGKAEQVVAQGEPPYYDVSSALIERSQPVGFALPYTEEDKR